MLSDGMTVKIKDIANELEISERQIKRYKEILSDYVDIEATTGRGGGYRLKDIYFPLRTTLTEAEIDILRYNIDSIENFSQKDKEQIKRIIGKINYSILKNEKGIDSYSEFIPYSIVKNCGEKQKRIFKDIYKAIVEGKELIINYKDNRGNYRVRTVQPYKYLTYKGEKYLVANCLLRNEIRYFKLIRIQEYKVTDKTFARVDNIQEIIDKERENSVGIFGGKEYKLVLEVSPPMANTVSERIWVEGQEIEELEDGKIRFKATMKGGPEIISWILSMGDTVKVIEPIEIKEELKRKLINMLSNL